jgi:hypothetical protein
VLAKIQPHLLLKHAGLGDRRAQDCDQLGHTGRMHPGQLDPHRQLLAAQRRHDLFGLLVEAALASGVAEQGRRPGPE